MQRLVQDSLEGTTSIGDDLTEARRRAGLTVTDVSQRTRIRETIIRGIERDDYAGCGGDFYARGFIRSIADVVGADPKPLIEDYDAAHRAPQVVASDLLGPSIPVRMRERRRVNWTGFLGLVLALVIGFALYHVISASHHGPGAGSKAAYRPRPVASAPAASPSSPSYIGDVVVNLTAAQDCWVGFTTPRGRQLFQSYIVAGASKRWVFTHAVEMTLGNPAGVALTVNGKNPLRPGTTHPITLRLHPAGNAG